MTTTSKRSAMKKTGEKIVDERKVEPKNYREVPTEEFGNTTGLNLTLVGSPAPRSQIRALVSSTSIATAKCKGVTRHSKGSKLREPNTHEICMEKLYQFADNPTKFVRAEIRDNSQLKLDLEFSERSDEAEDYYDSHNIAFGENGEYRIPEYDHIRFLQFSVGKPQDPGTTTQDRGDSSASVKFDHFTETRAGSPNRVDPIDSKIAEESRVGIETPRSLSAERSVNDLSESGAPIAEFIPWKSRGGLILNRTGSDPAVDATQTYPLGSAINYKTNINPEVEKFMLDLGPELSGSDEKLAKTTLSNQLLNESILSKNFAGAMRLHQLEESVENSSRSSPRTSRTTLSQASSSDGTWHGHSLNSPYFASKESNSQTDSKQNLPENIPGYEEREEYLTIVKNEQDTGPSSEEVFGVQRYIFITDQFIPSQESHSTSSSESLLTKSEHGFTEKIDGQPASTEIGNPDEEGKGGNSSGESTSDYCISKMFLRSFSSSSSTRQTIEAEKCTPCVSLGHKAEAKDQWEDIVPVKFNSPGLQESNLVNKGSGSNVLYMTLEEVNLAADYTTRLSQIFNRVLKRSESKDMKGIDPIPDV